MPPITAPQINRPVWFDLTTSDLAAAKALYSDLFGWSYLDLGEALGHYTIAFTRDGQAAAAMAPATPDTPVGWTMYFGVADIDAAVARVVALSGAVLVPPMEVPGQGHMALCTDPDGATFGLWQGTEFHGAAVEGEPGAMAWCEVHTTHAAASAAFYANLFGLRAEKLDAPDMEYYTLHDGNPAVAGVVRTVSGSDRAPHWMVYFSIDSLARANALWQQHGGTLLEGPL
ncbi:MAG TPA: VOC family protein, partial [Gemmatimonas sp.]|uniref:VOC family protein n=1 Tax=Gemmatimonas sp. TaxID=1962908 RepID=UPI002EDA1A1A